MNEEAVGWSSEKMSEKGASVILAELHRNQLHGTGPCTLREKRELEINRKIEEQKKRESEEREAITLKAFWQDDYFPHLKTRVKTVSWVREESHFIHWLSPFFGDSPLRDITVNDLERLQDRIREENLTARSHEYILGTFRRIWKYASKRKIITAECPVSTLNLPQGENNSRRRVVTLEELDKILNALLLVDKTVHDLTLFAVTTGCRASEAFNLTWEHVDFDHESVLFQDTKNKEHRRVYLNSGLIEMLKQRCPGKTGQHVFAKSDGTPYKQAPSSFRNVVKKLGLNENRAMLDRVVFHTLRHTSATLIARGKTSLKNLQEMFGWRTPAMVFRYAKGSEDEQRKAIADLGNILRKDNLGASATMTPVDPITGEM
jgi:integrase